MAARRSLQGVKTWATASFVLPTDELVEPVDVLYDGCSERRALQHHWDHLAIRRRRGERTPQVGDLHHDRVRVVALL